jgi:hypothetical protein
MTINSGLFLEAFGAVAAPGSASLIPFLDAKSAMRLRQVCTCMRVVVDTHLTDEQVEVLAEKIHWLPLPPERSFFLKGAPDRCKRNPRFVEYAVRRNGGDYLDASEGLQQNRLIMKIALISAKLFQPQYLATLLEAFGQEIPNRGELLSGLEALSPCLTNYGWVESGMNDLYGSAPFNSDKDIVLAVVLEDGLALEHASPELRNDREIVISAVRENGGALQYASPELRYDREIVLFAVGQCGSALQYASDELKADRKIALVAVRQDPFAFQHASLELRYDREIVLSAVGQYGGALKYASDELKNDRDVVLAAVRKDGFALQFASPELQADQEIVLAAKPCKKR